MGRNNWQLFQIVLLLTLVILFFTVVQLMWASTDYLHAESTLSLLNNQWPTRTPFNYLAAVEHERIRSEITLSREETNDTSVDVTGNVTLRSQSFEDMPDKWCQYMKKSNKVNPHPYQFSIAAKSLCSSATPFMMIIVPSVCSHDYVRKFIRQTWGSVVHTNTWSDGQKLPPIKLAFLFGYPETQACSEILQNETTKYGDIIVSEFRDTYRNLTLKSVAALKWVSYYCPHVQYVLKCDEDTFVHLPRLVKFIQGLNSSNTLIGRITIGRSPHTAGRWEVSANQYPFRVYTPYLQGQAYVLPGEIVLKLYELSEYFDFMPIEDVFVTGILARCARASYRDSHFFNREIFRMFHHQTKCVFQKALFTISVTNITPAMLPLLWNSFKNSSECFRQ